MNNKKKKWRYITALSILFLGIMLYVFMPNLLIFIGEFLVVNEKPIQADAVIVLNTGLEYYPRLIQAADLYKHNFVKSIVINGNRKTDTLRELENLGFKSCCPWYEERVRILEVLGVDRKDIITISAEDAYDTVSEAQAVGKELIKKDISRILITTSKSHTRRARYIWKSMYKDQLMIKMIAAKSDPYIAHAWWKDGRQIRWLLAEYGAWIYYFLKMKGLNKEKVQSGQVHPLSNPA